MGTNYYARIIPSKERKKQLKDLIDNDDFRNICRMVQDTYSSPDFSYYENTICGGEIHLGKRSGGWKFLWNPNWYKIPQGHIEKENKREDGSYSVKYVEDGYDIFKYYDLNKESLKKFIDRDDVVIYDEYEERIDKEEFWDMALKWGYGEEDTGWDSDSYEEWESNRNPNRRTYNYANEYSRWLESCGFTMNKNCSDFYSDGLRFATNTSFS